MKTLTLAAVALSALAGTASAATDYDFQRFGVDADQLTPAQELTIQNAISSEKSFNEVAAVVNKVLERG